MGKQRKIAIQTIEGRDSYAIFKARADVDRIVGECGYAPLVLGSRSPVGIVRVLKRHYDICSLRFRLTADDTVFLQFPWIHNNKPAFYSNLFGSGARVDCIIHDLDSLRGIERNDNNELADLARCHSIIAHTPAMKKFLMNCGIDGDKIKTLNLFPYLTSDKVHELPDSVHELPDGVREQPDGACGVADGACGVADSVQEQPDGDIPTVVFAGNLTKSPFVNRLHEIATDGLRFNLYGNGAEHFAGSDYVKYCGAFAPDHPGTIDGNWGLVWDGGELDTCTGLYGEYLRYNSSHKASMCLALGIPVVLWEESSLKDFVTERNLGIAVRSLRDLPAAIGGLSAGQFSAIRRSARAFAAELRTGDILRRLI